jgi:hyperosmotically inducible protein
MRESVFCPIATGIVTAWAWFDRYKSKRTMKLLKSIGLAMCLGTMTIIGLTGCAGNRYEQSTGEYIDDTGTTSRVKRALADDPRFKYDDVNVSTFKGTVQLSGFVSSGEQKSRAEERAKNVEGVQEVVNNITVKD